MFQASLNVGILQLAMTSLSVLTSHSMHRQTRSFELAERIIWTNYFYYINCHIQQHCLDEDSDTTLRKLA